MSRCPPRVLSLCLGRTCTNPESSGAPITPIPSHTCSPSPPPPSLGQKWRDPHSAVRRPTRGKNHRLRRYGDRFDFGQVLKRRQSRSATGIAGSSADPWLDRGVRGSGRCTAVKRGAVGRGSQQRCPAEQLAGEQRRDARVVNPCPVRPSAAHGCPADRRAPSGSQDLSGGSRSSVVSKDWTTRRGRNRHSPLLPRILAVLSSARSLQCAAAAPDRPQTVSCRTDPRRGPVTLTNLPPPPAAPAAVPSSVYGALTFGSGGGSNLPCADSLREHVSPVLGPSSPRAVIAAVCGRLWSSAAAVDGRRQTADGRRRTADGSGALPCRPPLVGFVSASPALRESVRQYLGAAE